MNDTTNTSTTENNECFLTDEQINQSYNLGLHVASIFVLLAVSLLGASISVVSARVKRLRISPIIINTGKFFGSGVVLATGFIHILPDAMETLSDPCLPDSWNEFSAYGGLFAMLAALAMQLIEFVANQKYRSMRLKHAHITVHSDVKECDVDDHTLDKVNESIDKVTIENEKPQKKKHVHDHNTEHTHHHVEEHEGVEPVVDTNTKSIDTETNHPEGTHDTNNTIEEVEHSHPTHNELEKSKEKKKKHHKSHKSEHKKDGHHHSHASGHKHHHDIVTMDIVHVESLPGDLCEGAGHQHGIAFQDDDQHNKISTYLLELGIALHSVLIGLTLGTTSESFVALFIALCFHQFFEAIALGAQIAHLKTTSIKPAIYMIVFFSLTTPVGIAIGIGIHSGTYNPKSISSLLVTGILDSLSAGVLIYVALVNLITAEMGANAHAFYSLSTRLKFLYFAALYLGVAAMTVIGRWA